jgi:hypothetical protein
MNPGSLTSSEQINTSISGAKAWRIAYTSEDANGTAHTVTGLVIAPDKPGSDRAIASWCHGTTGIGDAACPSAQPDPARELVTYFSTEATQQIDYGIPGLQRLIDSDRVVVATDYQGLGSPGIHQYSVNRTNARDSVFIAHAARSLDVGAGTQLLSFGWSQGGGASAAVSELDDADFGDLTLLGCALLSPGVTGIALTNPVGMGAALADPTLPPDSHLVMTLAGHAAGFPDDMDLTKLLTPLGVEIVNAIADTQPVHHMNDTLGRLFKLKGAILDLQPEGMEQFKAAVIKSTAGAHTPRCPILMCVDSFGGGLVIPVAWQTAYAEAATKLGGTVETADFPKDDHFSLPDSSVDRVQTWFDGLLSRS